MTTPMTVIGGFLGAGKTTLLNHVLRHAENVRYAVLVNDFGEIAIDDRLVVNHGGDTVQFANGCLCCTLGDNLLDTVDRLIASDTPPDQFLVEASGVADPQMIADLAILHPDLRPDLVVVLCDATSIRSRAGDPRLQDTVDRQIAAADLLILNHCDRQPAAETADVRKWLKDRTGLTAVAVSQARVDLTMLDGVTHLDRSTLTNETNLPNGTTRRADTGNANPDPVSLVHPFHTQVVRGRFRGDIDSLVERVQALGPSVLRAKGTLQSHEAPHRWCVLNKVGDYVQVEPVSGEQVLDEAGVAHESALVLLSTSPLPDAGALASQMGIGPA